MNLIWRKQTILATVVWFVAVITTVAQPHYKIIDYTRLNDAVNAVHRIVKDNDGMMWFATDDGLYRYDGYNFVNFKTQSGDGVNMLSNRINTIYASSGGGIWCLVSGRPFMFDTGSCRFIDVLADFEKQKGKNYIIRKLRALSCGTTWLFAEDGTMMVLEDARPRQSVRQIAEHVQPDNVTVLCDSNRQSWVLTSHHTYLYKNGNVKRFNQAFRRIVCNGGYVWFVDNNGKPAHYDERRKQITHWHHQALTSEIVSMSVLGDGTVAMSDHHGLLLVAANGSKATQTQVTWPVKKMMEDGVGRLWILAFDGTLSVTDRECRKVSKVEGVRHIDKCDIMCDKHGTVWIFTGDGDTYYATSNDPTHPVGYAESNMKVNISNTIEDGQGGYWFIHKYHAYRLTFESPSYRKLPLHQADQVRCVVTDAMGRLLVCSRYDEAVTLFTSDGQPLGWLGRDGQIHSQWTAFGRAVYCGLLASDGTLWLGTKHDGLLRLSGLPGGGFEIKTFNKDNGIADNEIYDLAEDSRHRLWIATHKGGLCCISDCRASTPAFATPSDGLTGWRQDANTNLRTLLVTPDEKLMVGMSTGLAVADISTNDLSKITFRQHSREPLRKASLSSSNVSDIIRTGNGHILISTTDGGINLILTEDITADELEFHHYNRSTGFPADMVHAITEYDHAIWAVAPDQLVELQPDSLGHPGINTFLLRERPHFSSCKPATTGNGKWVFGAEDGALMVNLDELKGSPFSPPLVVTGISKENSPIDHSFIRNDTIVMGSHERDLTLWFAALDFEDTERVAYAYRMDDGTHWTYIGQNHSITLAQMQPGVHQITIRSTNSAGAWCDNQRTLTIIVTPTFWETPWAKLLILAIIILLAAIITYTIKYIRRIKRNQHETMEAYLALLEQRETLNHIPADEQSSGIRLQADDGNREALATNKDTRTLGELSNTHRKATGPFLESDQRSSASLTYDELNTEPSEDDLLMKRVVAYMENNLGNSDVTIDDIAQAVAVSRTSLHRKMKQMMGTSPIEFLREARIRKAAKMLSTTKRSVSEIAYACGFTDPKYFSKCFKAITGKTPSEFKLDITENQG